MAGAELKVDSKWEFGKQWSYHGRVVECRTVQSFRYWVVGGFLHRSPMDAMERVDGTGLYAKRRRRA